jgi:hypothetical protein
MLGKHLTNEEKLDAIYQMTLDNHEVLKTIRRQQYIAGFIRILYWLAVLGVIGGFYLYAKPFIEIISGNSAKIENLFLQFKQQLPEARVLDKVINGTNQ